MTVMVGDDTMIEQRGPPAKGTPAQIFLFGRHVFCFLGHWLLIFCYDLDLCSQRQAVRCFLWNGFFPNIVKSTRVILIKCVRNLHRQVAHHDMT